MRDVPVESLTCEACARQTITSDLPPIGIDVAAVLEQLAAAGRSDLPSLGPSPGRPTCACGARVLLWSFVVTLVIHVAGATVLGEVPSTDVVTAPTGTLSCAACSRAWDVTEPDLPPQIHDAISAFSTALSRGEVRLGD